MARKADAVREVARRGYWREADALVLIEAWRRSGEPLARFARRYGVRPRRLARWLGRLGGAETESLVLHPVRLVQSPPRMEAGAETPIEIELSSGVCVRVAAGFASEDLHRVLFVLRESASC